MAEVKKGFVFMEYEERRGPGIMMSRIFKSVWHIKGPLEKCCLGEWLCIQIPVGANLLKLYSLAGQMNSSLSGFPLPGHQERPPEPLNEKVKLCEL